jgi:hypothetical protein
VTRGELLDRFQEEAQHIALEWVHLIRNSADLPGYSVLPYMSLPPASMIVVNAFMSFLRGRLDRETYAATIAKHVRLRQAQHIPLHEIVGSVLLLREATYRSLVSLLDKVAPAEGSALSREVRQIFDLTLVMAVKGRRQTTGRLRMAAEERGAGSGEWRAGGREQGAGSR